MQAKVDVRYVILLAATAGLGGLLFGFDIAIITGAGPFLVRRFGLDDLSLGWAFSSLLFGCILGSGVAGRLADLYGRRKVLLWAAVFFAVTSAATGLAFSASSFMLARFLGGLAVGAASLVSPMYISEVSPKHLRGRMGTLYQLAIVSGILVSYCINYLLRNTGPDNWRWMFLSGVVPSVIFLLLLLRAPETPRYLLMAGRPKEAQAMLERIAGPVQAAAEMKEIQVSLQAKRGNWRDLLRPGMRRAVLVGFSLAVLIHVSGINTVIDYAPAIFRSAGWKMDAALLSTFVIGLTNFSLTVVSFWTIDRYGRRPLYIIGSLGMTVALAGLVLAVVTGHFEGSVVLLLIILYLAFFCSCIGPVFWTLVPEMFPNHIRGTAMTVPVLTQWAANALVVLFFPYAFNRIGKAVTFGFLAAMALTQAIFTYFLVPETKNKPLEEMEALWNNPGGTAGTPGPVRP